ncbi:MAG: hypothetical protein ABEJ74_04650, partial [Haloferacaceae archaeon]
MADAPSPATAPAPALVKRALRALADGTAPRACGADAPSSPTAARIDAAAVVEEATTSLQTLRSAATFVDDGGLDRLREAVAVAEARGDRSLARAGQHLLARVDQYRAAATVENRAAATTDSQAEAAAGDH